MSLSGEGIFPRTSLSFNLKYLQEDIVSIYLSGRPIIKDVSSLRSVFKFRLEETNTQPSEYVTIYVYIYIIYIYIYIYFFFILLSVYLSIHYVMSVHRPTIYHLSIYNLFIYISIDQSIYLSVALCLYSIPHSSPLGAASDLLSIKDLLPDSFSAPLCDDLTRHLEYEFHSANYHTLTDIVIGLRTALGHLIKVGVV